MPLIAVLDEGSFLDRAAAADALGAFKDRRAVEPLLAVFDSVDANPGGNPNWTVAPVILYAALSLGEIGDPRAAIPLAQYVGDAREKLRTASSIGLYHLKKADALGPLQAELRSSDRKARAAAEQQLLRVGALPAAIPAADLKNSDVDVRFRAIVTLTAIQDPAAIPPLIEAFQDPNANNRFYALQAVQTRNDPRLVEPLLAVMENGHDPHDRVHAAQNLARYNDPRLVLPMIAALGDPEEYVRGAAASSLGLTKDPRAIAPLIAAITTLKTERWLNDNMNAAQLALVAIGEPAVPALLAALNSPDEHMRNRAAKTLTAIHDARAIEPIAALLNDPHRFVREGAAFDLARFQDARSVEPLLALAQPGKRETRQECINPSCSKQKSIPDKDREIDSDAFDALGRSNDPRAIDFLLRQLQSDAPNVRLTAIRALGESSRTGAVESLISLLKDGNQDVVQAAAESLGKGHDPRAVQPLIDLIHSGNDASAAAWQALVGFHDPREIPLLISSLDRGTYRSGGLTKDLVAFGPVAVPPLLAALKSPSDAVRAGAAEALGGIDDARVGAPLLDALRRRDFPVTAGAHRFFMGRKDWVTHTALLYAFHTKWGNGMAGDFLNSHDEALEHAGEEWVVDSGLAIGIKADGSLYAYSDCMD
jgi:HEAT repeat protein